MLDNRAPPAIYNSPMNRSVVWRYQRFGAHRQGIRDMGENAGPARSAERGWGLLLLVWFAGNVIVATLAWFLVSLLLPAHSMKGGQFLEGRQSPGFAESPMKEPRSLRWTPRLQAKRTTFQERSRLARSAPAAKLRQSCSPLSGVFHPFPPQRQTV
jgi:hypothetical protein